MLRLTTGEELEVSELDLSVVKAPKEVLEAFAPLMALCTQVTREQLEEAKAGYDDALKKELKSSPIGCLLKNPSPTCGLIRDCGMAKPIICTTKNVSKNVGTFPSCWTYDTPDTLMGFEYAWVAEICDAVIHAWREGRFVIIVV